MSAIAGYILKRSLSAQEHQEQLKKMSAVLVRPGHAPVTWFSLRHHAGMIQQKLVSDDASEDALVADHYSAAVVFFGELYNSDKIQKQLELVGYQFFSGTVTELLLAAYAQWSSSFVEYLDGSYVGALFDTKTEEFFLFQDDFGLRDLYVYQDEHGVLFSSDVRVIWSMEWVNRRTRRQSVKLYLSSGTVAAPDTLYEQLYVVPAGDTWRIRTHQVEKSKRSSLLQDQSIIRFVEYDIRMHNAEQLERIARAAIQRTIMSNNIALFLQPNLSSLLLVALTAHFVRHFQVFTVTDERGRAGKESSFIRQLVRHFGATHLECVVTEQQVTQFLRDWDGDTNPTTNVIMLFSCVAMRAISYVPERAMLIADSSVHRWYTYHDNSALRLRFPFLDKRLLSYVYGYQQRTNTDLFDPLSTLAAPLLPHAIQGSFTYKHIDMTMASWLTNNGPFTALFKEFLYDKSRGWCDFFDLQKIESMLVNHQQAKERNEQKIVALYLLMASGKVW